MHIVHAHAACCGSSPLCMRVSRSRWCPWDGGGSGEKWKGFRQSVCCERLPDCELVEIVGYSPTPTASGRPRSRDLTRPVNRVQVRVELSPAAPWPFDLHHRVRKVIRICMQSARYAFPEPFCNGGEWLAGGWCLVRTAGALGCKTLNTLSTHCNMLA